MNILPCVLFRTFWSRSTFVALSFLGVSLSSYAQVLVTENFDSYSTGNLTPQGGWATVSTRKTGLVATGPGGGNTSNTYSRNTAGGDTVVVLNSNSLFAAGSVSSAGSNSKVLLTFDIYAGAANSISLFGIGSSSYVGNVASAQFGIWNGNLAIRGENFGTISNAVNSSGTALTLTTGNWYSVQSLWDLSANGGQGSASLAIKNLTAGDSNYTTLYFNSAQTAATVSLGITSNSSLWTSAYLRTGQSTGNGVSYLDNLNAQVVPEPSVISALLLGASILAFRRRENC